MNPNADEPIHATTFEPRSARRAPTSNPPILSSESRATIGLCMTVASIRCASLTIKPTEKPPTRMSTRSNTATTRLAAAFGGATLEPLVNRLQHDVEGRDAQEPRRVGRQGDREGDAERHHER